MRTDLTTQQLTDILTGLSVLEDLRLRNLVLSEYNLSSVPTNILVAVISGLEKVTLDETYLTKEQLIEIFIRLSVSEDHKLRKLKFFGNDLSLVPTDLLVAGVSGLETVELIFNDLTTEQLSGIYRMVADRGCSRMRKIVLIGNDLSSISPDLRGRAKLNQSVYIREFSGYRRFSTSF